jgi:CRP-like cAMP-binding protein
MHNKERNDEKLINDCLMSHFFMQYLNEQARNAIIEEMSLIQVDKNNYIFKQGAIGNYFYILKSGTAHLIIDNKLMKILRIGESFGELALLHDAPRSGSIKAISDCLLYILERKNFRKIVEHITKINYEENLKFLESVSILSHMEQYQKTILSNNLVKEEFEEGRKIVTKGEFSSCLYIIKSGLVDCIDDNGVIIRTLKEGDNFGERSILSDTKRTLDVVAKTDCVCYSISIATLKSMLGEKYRSFLYLNFMKSAFKKSKLLNQLNTYFVEEVFQFFEAVNLGYDNVAFPIKHNKSSNIVIIIDGNLINVRIILYKLFI